MLQQTSVLQVATVQINDNNNNIMITV